MSRFLTSSLREETSDGSVVLLSAGAINLETEAGVMRREIGLPIVSANFLFAALGDDAVANTIDGALCAGCGLKHVWSSAGAYCMEPGEWHRYRVLCGREAIVAAKRYEIESGVGAC